MLNAEPPMTYPVPSWKSFQDDLKTLFVDQLTKGGYEFPHHEEPRNLAILYYALRQRTIPRLPRVVHWSAELQGKCSILAEDISLALTTIEAESLAGEDLNPRLSRRYKDTECHDDLFNSWGILHLHLGPRSPRAGELAKGRNELLFVMVQQDAIYFIDQRLHNVFRGEDSDLGLLEIVHKNWPQIIAHARLDDVYVPLEGRRSLKEQASWRKTGFVVPTVMSDGTVYGEPGGGPVRARGKRGWLNSRAVATANAVFQRAGKIHEWCRENTSELIERLRRSSGTAPKSLEHLHIGLGNDGLFVVEHTTGGIIRF